MSTSGEAPAVWVAKNYDKAKIQASEAPALVEKLRVLAAWARGELTEVSLDLAPLKETRRSWWRLKARPFRVFFLLDRGEVFVGEIDRRDDNTYRDIRRLDKIAIARAGEGVRLIDTELAKQGDGPARPRGGRRTSDARLAPRENPLSRFTDKQLISLGLPAEVVPTLRALAPSIDVSGELARLGVDAVPIEAIAAAWAEPDRMAAIFAEGRTPSQDELGLAPDELLERMSAPSSSADVARLDEAELTAILGGGLEDWMIFMHPSQARLAHAEPTGPVSIRGGPGTGKTVVALRRAAWLVTDRDYRAVLATSFVRALPNAWSDLFDRLVREKALRERITTSTVDKIARRVVLEAGGCVDIIRPAQRKALLEAALDQVPEARTALGGVDGLEDEIDVVIAGRGLSEEGYLKASRRGRRRPLGATQRSNVWSAYEVYLNGLDASEKTDWQQLRLHALQLVERGKGPRFDAIIIDEAQDLSEVQLRFLIALDADPEHKGITLVADAAQAIYSGGARLTEIGLDTRGRASILRGNWRNSQFIATAARAVLAEAGTSSDEADRDGQAERVDEPQRLGDPVTLHLVPGFQAADSILQTLVEDLVKRYLPGEIAVVAPTRREEDLAVRAIGEDRTSRLRNLRGFPPRDRVSVGTYHGVKGLEFKAVVVTDVGKNFGKVTTLLDGGGQGDDTREEVAMLVRSLYVAMTRARDELSMIAVQPVPVQIDQLRPEFDVEEW